MNAVTWLRTSYWAAAIADFIVAVLVMIPEIQGIETYVLPMGLMSAVAISWGIMLIIADRKPLERRWIAIPTMIVVLMLMVTVFLSNLFILLPAWIPVLTAIKGTAVFSLLLYGYRVTAGLV